MLAQQVLGERAHAAAVVDGDRVEVRALAGAVGEHHDGQPLADRGDVVVGESAGDDDETVDLAGDGKREFAPAAAAGGGDEHGVTGRGGCAFGAADHLVDVER